MANNNKNLVALFNSQVTAPNGTQKALTVVSIPDGEKTWVASTVAFAGNRLAILKTTNARGMQLGLLATLFPECHGHSADTSRVRSTTDGPAIKLTSRIDMSKLPLENAQARPAKLGDTDFTNGGSTLQAFLANNGYDLDPSIQDPTVNLAIRKVAFPQDKVNYDLFWNSPLISDEEKKVCTPKLDLDICMSNASRPCFRLFRKIMTTRYFNKNFTAVGLHGNPGGGKSQMVTNWCALEHIPLVTIPCDPMMGITQILSQVGPKQNETVVDKTALAPLIQGLKAKLDLLQQNPTPDEAEIRKVLEALDKAASISKEAADLVKTPSILMKCLKNDLPLVVFLDEANIASTAFQNSLAPIISDGVYKDGPVTGRNSGTIKWVLAWNPATTNAKSFDGKFFDRLFFLQVPDLSAAEQLSYRTRKIVSGMYGAQASNAALEKVAKKEKKRVEAPVLQDILNQATAMTGSDEARAWYASYLIEKKFPTVPTFKENEFKPAYLEEVQISDPASTAAAIATVDGIVDLANTELCSLTRGKDTKNPDKNSYYYISGRNRDIFLDMVMGYSSVTAGLVNFIYNLIPGGCTVKAGGTVNPLNDTTPAIIATTIASKLGGQCDQAQQALFNPNPVTGATGEAPAAIDILNENQVETAVWVAPAADTPKVTTNHAAADVDAAIDALFN